MKYVLPAAVLFQVTMCVKRRIALDLYQYTQIRPVPCNGRSIRISLLKMNIDDRLRVRNTPIAITAVEIVERKGMGRPDSPG